MRVAISLLLVALTAAPLAAQMTRATRTVDLSRILVITAHPGDESLVAPLLGEHCGVGSTCKLLVMTRGENGDCNFDDDDACNNLGDIRTAELTGAAAILHTQLEAWTLPDVSDRVVEEWGGEQPITTRLANAITDFNPTAIITFDPTHGSTCEPSHRAVSRLVTEAAGERPVFFVETRARLNDDTTYVLTRATSAASHLYLFDLSASWHFMRADMSAHVSQFTPEAVFSVAEFAEKMLVLMPAKSVAVYDAACE